MGHASLALEAPKWHDKGNMICIAVNVSGEQFQQSDIVAHTRLIEETGINPHLLELEVTESFMEDIQQTVRTLKELHALGVELQLMTWNGIFLNLIYANSIDSSKN